MGDERPRLLADAAKCAFSFQGALRRRMAERSAEAGRSRFQEPLKPRCARRDERRQRLEVVAAFEHGGDARAERGAALGELPEPVLRHLHLRQRVLPVRVEAGRDEDEVRRERAHGRLDRGLERRAGTRRRPNAPAAGGSASTRRSCPGRPYPARTATDGARRRRRCRRRGRAPRCRCRDGRRSRRSRSRASPSSSCAYRAATATLFTRQKPIARAGERVVPGRPDEREAAAVDRLERDPGRERRRLPRRLRADGVGVELNRAVDRLQQLQVGRARGRAQAARASLPARRSRPSSTSSRSGRSGWSPVGCR